MLPLIAFAATAYRALWWEPRHRAVDPPPAGAPGLAEELAGLRVAVIADLHTGAPHESTCRYSATARPSRWGAHYVRFMAPPEVGVLELTGRVTR